MFRKSLSLRKSLSQAALLNLEIYTLSAHCQGVWCLEAGELEGETR